jgi:Tol biopolymer transport system component
MPLARGDRVGPYEIIAALGAGGMGEVYRAHDAKLKRDVALKILPDAFASDSERMARFQREAQVLASISHPNIGHIYGLEDSGATHALVLELIPGQTLAERIALGPIRLADSLAFASQIADALEAAHDRGIVHRDLKPANIKVQPDDMVKVLDFGLAKALDPVSAPGGMTAPTQTSPAHMTRPGVMMGTAAYMSPEQARGMAVDRRCDIWAFGCVLFEMITGRLAFSGDTVSDTIVSILSREPDWGALPAETPSRVRTLLQRCLDKDARQRLRDIGDARLELAQVVRQPDEGVGRQPGRGPDADVDRAAPARVRSTRTLSLAAAAAAAIGTGLAGGLALFNARESAVPVPTPTPYTQITNFNDSATAPSLSPDGRMVTFIRGGEAFLSTGQIYVKLLPNGEAVQLTTGSSRKYAPVFAPDGSRVAYSDLSEESNSWDTWTVPVHGGPPRLLLPNATGLTWIGERDVLFAEIKGVGFHMGIVTAAETRAQSREIYMPAHENAMVHYAYASPDRKSILAVEMDRTHTFNQPCRLLPFDGSSMGRQVGPKGFCTAAAWSPDGQWMYFNATVGRGSHIWRQRFPDGAVEQITSGPSEEEGIAIDPDGRSLITSVGERRSAIWLHDAAGDRELTSEGFAGDPQISADGQRVFYLFLRDLSAETAELRSIDLATGRVENLLPGLPVNDYDISRDGKEVAFTIPEANGDSSIWIASLDRRAAPRKVVDSADQVSFGAAGVLLFRSLDERINVIGRVRTDGSHRERLTAAGPILDKYGVSPDGRWAVVQTAGTETAEPAMVVVSVDGAQPITICGLCESTWSSDGRYFYVAIERSAAWSPRASWALAGSSIGETLAIPVPPGRSVPEFAAGPIDQNALRQLKGARVIPRGAMAPGRDPSTYVFAKTDLQRNLYRIPLP